MRDARTLSWDDRRQQLADGARRWAASAWLWGVVAVSLGALMWLVWPRALTPQVLRHGASAKAFVEVLWQVVATALALSAAIVTFSFATFSTSRVALMGGSLPRFARSSGLLVGIAIGLVAIAACGASLLAMPLTPPAPNDTLARVHCASAVAAVVLSAGALALIPVILRQSLRAGDRSWLQAQLRVRIEAALDLAVVLFIERTYARVIMREVMDRHQIELAPLADPGPPQRPGHLLHSGVVVDVRLRRLVKLRKARAGGTRTVLVNPIAAANALGYAAQANNAVVWVTGPISRRQVSRIFRVSEDPGQPGPADDLDRLHAQGLAAIRDDDEVWYREVAAIHRAVLLHLINSWQRFGAAPGRAPAEDEVGLRPLTDHLEAQVHEIIEQDRPEIAAVATEVPLSVGLSALEHGPEGAGLAQRMMWSLGHMAIDATSRKAQPAADRVRDSAMQAVFMLLRAGGDAL
jgi:hypothetical protein